MRGSCLTGTGTSRKDHDLSDRGFSYGIRLNVVIFHSGLSLNSIYIDRKIIFSCSFSCLLKFNI